MAFLKRLNLPTLLVIAFSVRLIWFVLVFASDGLVHTEDSAGYVELAENLYRQGEFAQKGGPDNFRTPGYPAFLGLGMLLGHITWGTLVLQVVLSTLSVPGLYRIVRHLGGRPETASLAALLFALEPLSIIYSLFILTETLFVFLLIWCVERFCAFVREPSTMTAVTASALLAALAFVRPLALYLPWFVLLMMLICHLVPVFRKRRPESLDIKQSFILMAIVMGVVYFPVMLWKWRNETVLADSRYSRLNLQFLNFQAAATLSRARGQEVAESWKELEAAYEHNPDAGRDVLLEHPTTFLALYTSGWVKTLGDPGTVDASKQLKAYPLSGGLANQMIEKGISSVLNTLMSERPVLFMFTLILGVYLLILYYYSVQGCRLNFQMLWPLIFLAAYFLLFSGGSNALARYRCPLMPLLVVFAAMGFVRRREVNDCE